MRVDRVGERGEVVDRVERDRVGIAEAGDHRERRGRVVGHLVHVAARRHPEHVAVEDHHLAVEILEGAEAEVAVLAHHAHRHRTLVHALHQRARGRHLVQRVVLHAEVLGQRALHQVVARRAAAARQFVERVEDAAVDAGVQLGHDGQRTWPDRRRNPRIPGTGRRARPSEPSRRPDSTGCFDGEGTHASSHLLRRARARGHGRRRRSGGACGGLVGENGTIQLTRTTTLAAYHDGVERYVTSFEFSGTGESVGSIVPLPGIPTKVERGGDWTLQRLAAGDRAARRRSASPLAADAQSAAGAAEVLQQTQVDALDITILRGGGDEVGKWAIDHGFLLTPDAPEVLDFYSHRSKIFMAARFDAARAASLGQQSGDGTPIMLTIPTDEPWVPLRILALGLDSSQFVNADVFLLTDQRPTVLAADTGVEVARSEPASTSLLDDLRSDTHMGWVPESMWFTYYDVSTPAGELRHDLAVSTHADTLPSARMAGFSVPASSGAADDWWIPVLLVVGAARPGRPGGPRWRGGARREPRSSAPTGWS